MESGRADEFYSTEEGLLINLEEESEDVDEKTMHKFSNYAVFGDFIYSGRMYTAVICHKDPKNYPRYYERGSSLILKVHYIHFTQEEIWKKYENVINKIKQKIELTETEALDIAFTAKFVSKKHAPDVIRQLAENFKDAKIPDRKLKTDVGVILGGMILKYIKHEKEQDKLMEKINMRQVEKEIHKLVYDEYGDVLDAKDKEIIKLNKDKEKSKRLLEKLRQMDDLNPEAENIINTLILL